MKVMGYKHGGHGTPLYIRWKAMRQRCAGKYKRDGIKVCPEWDDFAKFAEWAESAGFRADLTLDRIDNDGDYSPDNCRWTTQQVQQANRRPAERWRSHNRVIPNSARPTIAHRLNSGERAVELAAEYGVGASRIYEIRDEVRRTNSTGGK